MSDHTIPANKTRHSKAATVRFECRMRPELKHTITAAAATLGVDASDFARDTLAERAQEILDQREKKTVVPAAYFDDLIAMLDEPLQLNENLRRAYLRSQELLRTDDAVAHND